MSNEWNAEMGYLTTEQKAKANEIKAIITTVKSFPGFVQADFRIQCGNLPRFHIGKIRCDHVHRTG